jgi:hypothetical protein
LEGRSGNSGTVDTRRKPGTFGQPLAAPICHATTAKFDTAPEIRGFPCRRHYSVATRRMRQLREAFDLVRDRRFEANFGKILIGRGW